MKRTKLPQPPALRRRDGSGHINPEYACRSSRGEVATARKKTRCRFFEQPIVRDEVAEEFGEEFVETVTGAQDEGQDVLNRKISRRRAGGPFVETTAGTEFASGTDVGPNLKEATRRFFRRPKPRDCRASVARVPAFGRLGPPQVAAGRSEESDAQVALRVEVAFVAVLLGALAGCAPTQDDASALANAVNGSGRGRGRRGFERRSDERRGRRHVETGAPRALPGNGGATTGSGGDLDWHGRVSTPPARAASTTSSRRDRDRRDPAAVLVASRRSPSAAARSTPHAGSGLKSDARPEALQYLPRSSTACFRGGFAACTNFVLYRGSSGLQLSFRRGLRCEAERAFRRERQRAPGLAGQFRGSRVSLG